MSEPDRVVVRNGDNEFPAKAAGATVISTSSSDEKLARLKDLGAEIFTVFPDYARSVRRRLGIDRRYGLGDRRAGGQQGHRQEHRHRGSADHAEAGQRAP